MSVSMTKADGVRVITLTSDPSSTFPPLCQILRGLCYCPVLCSVSQNLRGLYGTSQAVLGTLQIMTGVLNLGLVPFFFLTLDLRAWHGMRSGYPMWLGILFILFGFASIFSGKFPNPCLVMVNVILNLCGVAFAITGIVLYSINTVNTWTVQFDQYLYYNRFQLQTTTPSPDRDILLERCLEGSQLMEMFVRSVNILLIVLSVLELCLVISSATLGIKALCHPAAKKSAEEPELYNPLLVEVTPNLKV